MFEELERDDCLPTTRRKFGLAEFHSHVRDLVRRERLHVLDRGRMTADAARALRGDLKNALTEVASGRAGVASLLHEIERITSYASGRPRASLGSAAKDMRILVGLFARFALRDTGLGGWAGTAFTSW